MMNIMYACAEFVGVVGVYFQGVKHHPSFENICCRGVKDNNTYCNSDQSSLQRCVGWLSGSLGAGGPNTHTVPYTKRATCYSWSLRIYNLFSPPQGFTCFPRVMNNKLLLLILPVDLRYVNSLWSYKESGLRISYKTKMWKSVHLKFYKLYVLFNQCHHVSHLLSRPCNNTRCIWWIPVYNPALSTSNKELSYEPSTALTVLSSCN